jgi:predicted MPP superfamily phosphohydrolase
MHIYVFWRAASIPFVKRHIPRKYLIAAGVVLWVIFLVGRGYGHGGTGSLAAVFELLGMNWLATLFLLFITLLAADIVTAFGYLLPRAAPSIRGWALVLGVMLSLIAMVQGLRPPVVEHYEVVLTDLPDEMDGTVVVGIADLHLGLLLDESWLEARIDQVRAEEPDLVVILGDLFEGHGRPLEAFLPMLRKLSAPLGVWAVPGNHESRSSLAMMEEAGYRILSSSWAELKPGLVLAGVNSGRRRESSGDSLSNALSDRPAGATILLSHRPRNVETAAQAGADLMLCGHTHGGQVWPFGYLVRLSYPLVEGEYEIDGMIIIVTRGTGTWGPRMRLWRCGEILRITLRADDRREVEL